MANGYYPPGYFTFHAEGASTNPITDSLHFPGTKYSGVTFGPGYDLKERTENGVYIDMISIGVSKEDANIIKKGIKKSNNKAKMFVEENKNKIKKLTKNQKIMLFKKIWGTYVSTAKRVYNNLPEVISEKDLSFLKKPDSEVRWKKVKWQDLDNRIIDIIVDLIYQGAYSEQRKDIKYASTKNDKSLFIEAIKSDKELLRMDKGRHRLPFLEGKEDGPKDF